MGFSKSSVIVLFLITLYLLLFTRSSFDNYLNEKYIHGIASLNLNTSADDMYMVVASLIRQRNHMSRELNQKQRRIGQLECEETTRKNLNRKISSTGGWCLQSSEENYGKHRTDQKLVPVLAQFLKGKYVASFGDGSGRYKNLLMASGLLKGYDSYDGAPFSEEISEGRVKYLDLTLPQYGLPLYDWIISLEVAEHIPREYENIYLDNIVRHAKEGVIISWARPGQGGYFHVNSRPFEYVKATIERHGFKHDAKYSEMFKMSASLNWFKMNINVYRRIDLNRGYTNMALLT